MLTITPENLYQPHANFPGDEAVAHDVYAECMQGRYSPVLAGAVSAAESFGVAVDSESIENWKRVALAGGMLDTFLDESPDQVAAVQLYKAGTAYVRGVGDMPERPEWADPLLEPAVTLLHNAVRVLPEERQTSLLNAADLVADISLAKAASTRARDYKQLLRLEGKLSGILINESASQSVYEDPRYEPFTLWTINLMEAATMADSAVDLKQDHADRLTAVNPSLWNAVSIAMGGIKSARFVFHGPNNRRAAKSAINAKRDFAHVRDAT